MKKRTWNLVLAAAMIAGSITTCLPASAADVDTFMGEEIVEPRYVGISSLQANLNISSSGMAECSGSVRVSSGYTAVMTMQLSRKDGRTWTPIQTWTTEGTGRLNLTKYKAVSEGYEYKVTVSLEVKNSSGKVVETPSDSVTFDF